MRAFRLDTSMQGEQRLDDAENWAWREIRTKSGQLLLSWVCRDGVVRGSGWRSGGPAFFRSLLVQQAWCIFLCTETEKEPENGGTRGMSYRRGRSGSFFK